jgi:hypothetical protein
MKNTSFGFYKTDFGTALHLIYKDEADAKRLLPYLDRAKTYAGKNGWHICGLLYGDWRDNALRETIADIKIAKLQREIDAIKGRIYGGTLPAYADALPY